MTNAQLQALQYVQNKFGSERLVLGGHRFRVKNRRNDRVYWRCSIPVCPATVNTHEGHPVKFGLPHNHTANQPKIEMMKVMQTMKQRAKAEVTPIPTIYEEELTKLRTPECNDDTRQIIEQLITYYSCKTALYHQRSLNIPGLPKTTTDINIQDKWCLTTAGDQFLSLFSVYLAKDTEMRTSDILQREQRHHPACTTSSSSTTCNTAHS
jgi:hypothetical protein